MEVSFHYLHPISFSNKTTLKSFLAILSKKEKTTIESLDVIFCDDEYLHELNVQHLQHDTLTDIITFDLTEKGVKEKTAELYISIPRIKENAKLFKTTITRELHRVVFHGVLHLCGYKDKRKEDEIQMRKKEDQYLNLYFTRRG